MFTKYCKPLVKHCKNEVILFKQPVATAISDTFEAPPNFEVPPNLDMLLPCVIMSCMGQFKLGGNQQYLKKKKQEKKKAI